MDENAKRTSVISQSTSSMSFLGSKDHQLSTTADTDMLVTQLTQQLKNVRNENNEFMKQISKLRKRINNLVEEKVVNSSTYNKDKLELQSKVVKLESQLERGEATKQTVEFDLTVARKKINDLLRSKNNKEATLSDKNMKLSDEKVDMELRMGEIENELILARKVLSENETKIALMEEEKRQLQSENMAEEALMRSDNEKLIGHVEDLKYQKEQLESKLADAKQSLSRQEEELRKSVTELKISMEREQYLRRDFDNLNQRAKSLEESVEAERAAHLESKFNSEIVNLKQQEYESQLAREKSSFESVLREKEEAIKKVQALESALSFERHQTKNANEKLEKSLQASADVRKQLESELDEKAKFIESLAAEMDGHVLNFNELKEELYSTKERQVYLEEKNHEYFTEINLLIENFGSENNDSSKPKKSGKKSPKQPLNDLKNVLFSYQKLIGDLECEVKKGRTEQKQTQKDCDNFRDLALNREKSLKDTKIDLTQCQNDLENIRSQQSQYVSEAGKTARDLEEVTNELQLQLERCRHLEESVESNHERQEIEREAHTSFLCEVHHLVCNASGGKNTLNKFSWPELSVAVREGIDSLINCFNRSKEKVAQLESSCSEMERSVEELQRAHESSVDRLADRCREREEEALRQRKQLEQHYEALLAEMNARTKKTQTLCDEAWAKLHSKEGVHDGLHAECSQLRGENNNLNLERKSLHYASALLLGAIFPALKAKQELAQQRALLNRLSMDNDICKYQIRTLVDTLTDEMTKTKAGKRKLLSPVSFRFIHPLIRFRVAVLAVLAGGRLRKLTCQSNSAMFSCDDVVVSNSKVMVMAGRQLGKKNKNLSPSEATMGWLTNTDIVHSIREATCGITDIMERNKGSHAIVKTAKNAFTGILQALQPHYSVYAMQGHNIIRERNSLCRLLQEGLDCVIYKANIRDVVNLFSTEYSIKSLQRHLLDFTERLHAGELEKRSLRKKENKLKDSVKELTWYKSKLDEKCSEIKRLEDRSGKNVSKGKFEGVYMELNAALTREKQAQNLLREQNSKLQELSYQLEEKSTDGMEKELTLNQAVNSLSEVKMELKRCAQNKRQLQKQVNRLELEKDKLSLTLDDAKCALKKAAGEKTSIAHYFESVERALHASNEEDVNSKLNNDNLFLDGGTGIKAAQRTVETFVKAQSSAVSRINNLEAQISSYHNHIIALKRELHDACHRETYNGQDFPTQDGAFYSTPLNGGSEFKPLKGEVFEDPSFVQTNKSSRYADEYKDIPTTMKDLTNTYK